VHGINPIEHGARPPKQTHNRLVQLPERSGQSR
jgi:hypothetical protein